jgi:N-acetylglutamate synthase-like GNAT family acetyltransferase
MAGIKIRRADSQESDDLAACIDEAYSIYAGRIDDLPAVSKGIAEAIEHHRVWVAESEQQIAGVMVLVIGDTFLMLENIAVRPDSAGKGIGRVLIAQAEEDARALGVSEIRLSTHEDMPENVAIYSRLGWRETGRSGNKVHMSKKL